MASREHNFSCLSARIKYRMWRFREKSCVDSQSSTVWTSITRSLTKLTTGGLQPRSLDWKGGRELSPELQPALEALPVDWLLKSGLVIFMTSLETLLDTSPIALR